MIYGDMLIVVDAQNDFISGPLGSEYAREILPNVVNKIKEYMETDKCIIFTFDTHDRNYLDTQEGHNLPVEHCIIGTGGWKLAEEIEELVVSDKYGDYEQCGSIVKTSFGARWKDSPYYDKWFSNDDIHSIEFIGYDTDICVISNILGLKPYIKEGITLTCDASCCCGTSKENHDAALRIMRQNQIQIVND